MPASAAKCKIAALLNLSDAKLFAKHAEVDLKVVELKSNVVENLEKMIYHLEEPIADIHGQRLVEAIAATGQPAAFAATLGLLRSKVRQALKPGDVAVFSYTVFIVS